MRTVMGVCLKLHASCKYAIGNQDGSQQKVNHARFSPHLIQPQGSLMLCLVVLSNDPLAESVQA